MSHQTITMFLVFVEKTLQHQIFQRFDPRLMFDC